jgi:hypothetical protein
MKIRPGGADHVDGQTDMTKLIVAFRNFAKAPNKYYNNICQIHKFFHDALLFTITSQWLIMDPFTTKLPRLFQKAQVFDHFSMSVAHYGFHSPMHVCTETATQCALEGFIMTLTPHLTGVLSQRQGW